MTSFVGRQRELGAVCHVMCGKGPQRVAIVTGEAGIGKSRLVSEAAEVARQQGAAILVGRCLPVARTIPLLPFGEALRGLSQLGMDDVVGPALQALPPAARAALPVLAPRLVRDGEAASSPPTEPQAPPQSAVVDDPSVLLVGLRDLILTTAEARPLVLVVEDVHWADPQSLDLLTLLTHASRALGVVVSMRDDEPQRAERLGDWLAATVSQPCVELVSVGPLADGDVETLASELAGAAAAPESLLAAVRARAGGNPLFAEQLVFDALTETLDSVASRRVPDRVAALLDRRLASASAQEQAVLHALAVAQRPMDQDDVARAVGVAVCDVTDPIRALVRRGLVHADQRNGTLCLRHALLADQIRAGLLPVEQRDWHRRVADALADRPDCEPAEVAAHWAAGGVPEQERRWSIVAAEAAEPVHAWSMAAALWARVDELGKVVTVDDPPDLHPTLRRVAALEAAGQEYVGAAVAREALGSGRYAEDPNALAQLVLARDFDLDDLDMAIAELRWADAALADEPPSEARSRVLRQLARRLADRGERSASLDCFHRALEVAEAAGADAFSRLLRGTLAVGAWQEGAPAKATLSALEELLDETLAHAQGTVFAHIGMYLTSILLETGQLGAAAERGRTVLADASGLGVGQTWAAGMVLSNALEAGLLLGRSGDARRLLEARRTGLLDGSPLFPHRLNEAAVLIPEGRLPEASRLLESIVREIIPGTGRRLVWAVLTLDVGFWAQDDPGQLVKLGVAATEELAGRPSAGDLAGLVWQISRLAAEVTPKAGGSLPVLPEMGSDRGGRRIPAAYRLMAQAETSRREMAQDPDEWLAAATAWSHLGCRHLECYARWRHAEVLVQRRHRVEGQQALRAAFELSDGHAPLRARIAALARHARLSVEEASAALRPGRAEPRFGLTDRELQILALLTQGRSNNEIGAALFISGKTASVHVTNILRKLRVTSRVQAAALAEREHLV